MFRCEHCGKAFVRQKRFEVHVASKICLHRKEKRYKCDICNSSFSKLDTLTKHKRRFHSNEEYKPCPRCTKAFSSVKALTEHMKMHLQTTKFEKIADFKAGMFQIYRMEFWEEVVTINDAFSKTKVEIMNQINQVRLNYSSFKVNIVFLVNMVQNMINNEKRSVIIPFRAQNFQVLPLDDLNDPVQTAFNQIERVIEDFQENGSGFSIDDIMSCNLEIALSKPLQGHCKLHKVYSHHNPEKSVITIEEVPNSYDPDVSCFFIAVAKYFLGEDFSSETAFDFLKDLWPQNQLAKAMSIKDIQMFEEQSKSKYDLSINVIFKDHNEDYFPVYASRNFTAKRTINMMLFYVPNQENTETILHYALIEDLGKVFPFVKKEKYSKKSHVCMNCFNLFRTEKLLHSHYSYCLKYKSQIVQVPPEGDVMKYKVGSGEVFADYVGYLDFETLTDEAVKACSCDVEGSEKKKKKCHHKSKVLGKMVAFSYCLIIVDANDKVCEHIVYHGTNAAIHCIKTLLSLGKKYKKLMDRIAPIRMTRKDAVNFETAQVCYHCKASLFQYGKLDKVIDHNHSLFHKGLSNYIGASHAKCNSARRIKKELYIFSHNFSGFESHLLLKALSEMGIKTIGKSTMYNNSVEAFDGELSDEDYMFEDGELRHQIYVSMIPINTEKVKTMKMNNVVFLDSLAFLSQSLEQLVKDLVASKSQFPIVRQWLQNDESFEIMQRKGIFPYDFCTSFEKVKNATEIPPIEKFYSKLTKSGVTEEEHEYACKVWKHFKCETLLDYCEVYCCSDVYYLADAMTNFRKLFWQTFNLDVARFLSLPMVAKQAMLKTTGVEIGLIHDQEICHLLRENIRGGLSFSCFRHFDQEEHSKFYGRDVSAIFLDVNNLVRFFSHLIFCRNLTRLFCCSMAKA